MKVEQQHFKNLLKNYDQISLKYTSLLGDWFWRRGQVMRHSSLLEALLHLYRATQVGPGRVLNEERNPGAPMEEMSLQSLAV